jgi:hypothetical protein
MRTSRIFTVAIALTLALTSGAIAGFFGGSPGSAAGGAAVGARVLFWDECNSASLPSGFGITSSNTTYSSSLNARIVGSTYATDSGLYNNAGSAFSFTLKESLTLEWVFVQRNTITGAGIYEQGAWLTNNGTQAVCQGRFAVGPVLSLKNETGATIASNSQYVKGHQYTCRLTINADKICSFWVQDETQGYTSTTWSYTSSLTFGAGSTFQISLECANTTLTRVAVYDGVPAGESAAGGTISPTFNGGTITSPITWASGGGYNFRTPELVAPSDVGLYLSSQTGGGTATIGLPKNGVVGINSGSPVVLGTFASGTAPIQQCVLAHYHAVVSDTTNTLICDGEEMFMIVRNQVAGTTASQAVAIGSPSSLATGGGTLSVSFSVASAAGSNNVSATLTWSGLLATTGQIYCLWIDAGGSTGYFTPAVN